MTSGWETASRGVTAAVVREAQCDTTGTHTCHNRHCYTRGNPGESTSTDWSWLPDQKQASAWVCFCLCALYIIASWNCCVQLRTSSILHLQQMVKTSWYGQVIHLVLQTRSPAPGRASGLLVHLWGTLVETHSPSELPVTPCPHRSTCLGWCWQQFIEGFLTWF